MFGLVCGTGAGDLEELQLGGLSFSNQVGVFSDFLFFVYLFYRCVCWGGRWGERIIGRTGSGQEIMCGC